MIMVIGFALFILTKHNYSFLSTDEIHLYWSHRKMEKAHIEYFQQMTKRGFKASQIYRVLTNKTSGSLTFGFTQRDVYNNLAKADRMILEGGYAKHWIDTFEDISRKENDIF